MRALSEDIIAAVLEYLPHKDLLNFVQTSRKVLELSILRDAALYKPLLGLLNREKTFAPTCGVLEKIKSLNMTALRKYLVGTDTSDCLEKQDYQRKLFVRTFFRSFGRIPKCPRFKWAYTCPEWKASFYHAMKDMKRNDIMLVELVNIMWVFQFKHYPYGERSDKWILRFNKDSSVFSSLHGETMSWRQLNDGLIQVELYPPLRSSRIPHNGIWLLQNENVIITQVGLISSDEYPLLDVFI